MTGKTKETSKPSLMKATRQAWIFLVIAGLGLGLAVLTSVQPDAPKVARVYLPEQEPQRVSAHTVEKLKARFARMNYDLSSLQQGDSLVVPRIWSDAVPADMNKIQQVDERKNVFVHLMVPLVLMANERIERDRQRIISIRDAMRGGDLVAQVDKRWLERMYEAYKVKPGRMNELLRRVDVVPVSLALAQGAIESGWGTSRFAREGNALYGQWTWGDSNEGIVPASREEGKTHKIQAFDSPLDSVASYIHNLNTHNAYKEFRTMRAQMRQTHKRLSGKVLAEALSRYSEKGWDYVQLLKVVINANNLTAYDKARLAGRRLAVIPEA
ncbi:glucosaminidase domain-containing protein [Aestuariispira ectoiniformans]|uniref:glucosaminidase domain-containing protein n=1 Tax=Aestuariispira ectoiniformans TaxID=2775080 RepID=UPI00223BDBB0|nr:glucosaminidase domain-containing protein [Aestuariispira ectoiniformans]